MGRLRLSPAAREAIARGAGAVLKHTIQIGLYAIVAILGALLAIALIVGGVL